ncbi:MAG: hypothetical protein LBN27_08385 [Prevotellaceae bacterium]|jgi:hypothetical protein|nr:hypothetical protein [Prevotellaceae bacterium]
MKKVIFTLTLLGGLFFAASTVSARGVIIYGNGEKIEVTEKLPDSITIDDEHVNLGVIYEQFSIFWVPMWNYGETKYVFLNDKEDSYMLADEEDLQYLRDELKINVPEEPSIGFWNKIGGKLIWAVVFALIIYGLLPSRKKEEEEVEIPQEEQG